MKYSVYSGSDNSIQLQMFLSSRQLVYGATVSTHHANFTQSKSYSSVNLCGIRNSTNMHAMPYRTQNLYKHGVTLVFC